MILEELIQSPQTWFTVAAMAITSIIVFLFSGEKPFIKQIFESKEKKAERIENSHLLTIEALNKKVDDLTAKLEVAMNTIYQQTLEIQKLTLRSEKNNQILDAIKKYMEDSKQPTHLLELLKNAS
jgi:cell shape-determining protein MreC